MFIALKQQIFVALQPQICVVLEQISKQQTFVFEQITIYLNIVLKDSHVIKIKHKIEDVKKQLANIIDLVKTMLILLKN